MVMPLRMRLNDSSRVIVLVMLVVNMFVLMCNGIMNMHMLRAVQ